MIIKFKEFAETLYEYSGGNRAAGFRYSKPDDNEANHYTITYALIKGEKGYIPTINYVRNINEPVNILEMSKLIKKIENAYSKVNLSYKNIKFEKIKTPAFFSRKSYTLTIDFYCYSNAEASNIFTNTGYLIDISGYEIMNAERSWDDEPTPRKIGFKPEEEREPIHKSDKSPGKADEIGYKKLKVKEPGVIKKGAYGSRFPEKEFTL